MRQKSSSLTVKLIPPMLLMLALIMAVICIIIFSVIRAEFHENLNRELKIKVDSNAGNMNVAIESMMQLIDNFCYDLESNTDMSFDTVKRALDAKLTTLPRESIPAFYVAIGGRNVLYETMGWIPAADFVVKERPWYINAAGNQTPQIISYADANTGIYAICASRGVTLNTGEQAVVALDMEISSWLDQNIVPGEAEYSFVTDSQGMIIFHRNPEFVPHAQSESYLTSAWPDYAHLEALGPDEIVEITDFDNVKYLFRSSPVKSGNFRIFTGIQSSQASKRINSLLIWLVPMMIGLIFLLGILSLVFIRRIILCPLQKLAAVSDRIAAGDIEAGFQHNAHDEIGVLSQNFGQVRDSIKGLIESVNHMSHEQSKGDLDARMDEKYFNGAYRNVASSVNAMVSGIVFMVDKTQDCLENFSNGDFSVDFPVLPGKQMRLTQSINQLQNNLKEIKYEISRLADNASQGNLSIRADMDGFSGDWAEALRGLNALLEAVAVPIAEASAAIGSIAQGSLNITIAGDYSGEFARIKDSVESTAEELSAYISEISLVLNHMADKNLTDFISREYLGEFVIIKDSLNKIIDNFNAFVSEIKYAAESVEVEAENVSGAGADLSRGAVEQTRAIEDLRIAIEDISHEAAVNAENAASAARMSEKSRSNAVEGNKKMESMLLAMDGVKQAANSISNIIDIMSSVASQTNLLAINASIEAARAGDKGRGFGVVADQIRDLANRSQDAAKQSQAIIENSLRKTEEGIHYAQETSEALHSIAGLVTEASRLIIDISGASEKQMQAIGGFSDKISQISTIIHNNSSLATQSVTAAQKLTEQSALLDALIEKFLLKSFSGQISGDSFGDFDALQDALSTG